MDLFILVLLSFVITSYCFNRGQFSCLLNFNNVNTNDVVVKDSTNGKFQEHKYTPKSGVQICKITDGVNIIWEDKQKLTQCLKATTYTKNNLIHLIHLEIKRTSKVSEDKFYKRFDSKFINITDKEYDILKLDPSLLTDNTVSFDVNSKTVDNRLFKTIIRPYDGVPTLLLEPLPEYKLVSIHDDFRVIWSKKSSSAYVENLIAYYFFTKYYLIMLKLRVNEEEKYACYLYKEGEWLEVEYYTFMNKFLRLKSHIPITGHLSFNILDLPGDDEYSIEKDEKYSIELSTYYPRRGFILNSVLKGDNIIWESARERCASIRLVKKKGAIYGINLSLMDDHDQRSTLNFVLEDHTFREVSEEDFKTFGKNLVDPSEFQKYHEEGHKKPKPKQEPEQPDVIIEEPEKEAPQGSETTEEVIDEEVIKNAHFDGVGSTPDTRTQDLPTGSESQPTDRHQEYEETTPQTESEPQLLDIADFNSRLFLRNSFRVDNVDTYEYLPMPGVRVSSIVDGSMLVWDNTKQPKTVTKLYVHHRSELSQLLKLITRTKNGEQTHFFKRHNASFESLDTQEFDSLFQKMTTSLGPIDNSILLNLSTTPQEKYFDYHNEFDDGVNVSKFVTKSFFKLTKITDGQHVLWQSTNNDKCSSIVRNKFHRNSELIVVNISLISGMTSKYLKKLEGDFSEIDKSTYDADFKTFKDSIPFISNVSLDINTPTSEVNFLYVEKEEGNFTRGTYYPKSGYVLNKVNSGSNVLWTSTRNRCKQVLVYKDSNLHTLVKLSFSNTTRPELYFNLVNGKFVKLRNSIEFNFTYKELNKPASDVDACSFCKSQLERGFTLEQNVNKIYLNTNVDTNNLYTCFDPDLVMNKIFVPKDGNAFNNVTDGNALLFNPRSDSELCVYVQLFYDNNGPRLAKLRTLPLERESKGNLIHLEISDNLTSNLSPDDFKTKLDDLRNELNKLKENQRKISLNISSPGSECVEKTGKFRELPYKEFKANDGYFFSKVVFSQDLIYPLDADEDCVLVRPYFFLDFVVLVELNFVVQGGNNTMLYLYRFGNDFTTLDFQHFNNLLRSISDLVSKCEVLDLGDFETENPYESKDFEPNTEYNLKNKLFSSGKKYFTTINIKGFKLWSANSDLFLAKNVYVYYQQSSPFLVKVSLETLDNDETNLFFEFKNDNWNTINYTQYMDSLENNTTSESQEPTDVTDSPDLYNVDITTNTNQEYVSYNSGKTNGVFYVEVSLKNGSDGIRSVSENGKLMWESSKQDLVCKKLFVYYFNGVPQLLKLFYLSQSNTESFSYKHVSNGYWLDIDDDIFNRKLASFESLSKDTRETELPVRMLFKLDTSQVDENLVKLTTHAYNNLFYKQYKPIGRNSFIEVVDGTEIWKSSSGHECNLVRIYFYKEVSILSKLFLSNDLGVDLYFYFYHTGGKWKKVTSNEFESHLDSLVVLISDDESADEEEEESVEDEHQETIEEMEEEKEELQEETTHNQEEKEESEPEVLEEEPPIVPEEGMKNYNVRFTNENVGDENIDFSVFFEGINEDSTQDGVEEESFVEVVEELITREYAQPQKRYYVENTQETIFYVILDLKKLDPELFQVENGSYRNIPFKKIKSKNDTPIFEIKENNLMVWSSYNNSYCTNVKFYFDDDDPVLAEIIVKLKKSKVKFFKKTNYRWELVDEYFFNQQLDVLRFKYNR